jgi:excisionase family DNA binding protein
VIRSDVYTVAECAEVLGLSQRKVYELCRQGLLPACKEGAQWAILKDVLYDYLREV